MSTAYSYTNSIPASWKTILRRYAALPESSDQAFATYIWIDGTRESMRCKTRTLHRIPQKASDVPTWGFCGFGTYMSQTINQSNRILVPAAVYPDPFHHEFGDSVQRHKLVLCEVHEYDHNHKLHPAESNKRSACNETMERYKEHKPWFGIEQEYALMDLDGHPLGWPKCGYPAPMGPYYCSVYVPGTHPFILFYCDIHTVYESMSVGADKAIGRDVIDAHYKAAMYAGANICGINAEAMPAQWEFQTGPTEGIAAADELWLSRFLLSRVAEDFGVVVSFDPKPVPVGNWSGSGAHCNFSTKEMREDGGLEHIETAVKRLQNNHDEHIRVYDPNLGEDNKRRLTGRNETADIKDCSAGVEDRQVALRIPIEVYLNKKGYLEDRRPAANCDPYEVCRALTETCCTDAQEQ